jgi:predicted amidophosphoribosyltransferase
LPTIRREEGVRTLIKIKNMFGYTFSMLNTLLDLLFPQKSLMGRYDGEFLTVEERRKLTSHPIRLDTPVLKKMGLSSIDRIVAGGSYAQLPMLRKAIYQMKYGQMSSFAKELGQLLVNIFPLLQMPGSHSISSGPLAGPELETEGVFGSRSNPNTEHRTPILCPVPLHWTREFSRGFNQAELLARVVSQKTGIPVVKLLKRKRPTGYQARRERSERKKSMIGVFTLIPNPNPNTVILIDDIMTTGATLDACARTLKDKGAERVYALVCAKG